MAEPMRLTFGAWRPDLAPHDHDGLTVCDNVLPMPNGYGPVGRFQPVAPPLDAWRGGGAFTGPDGTTHLLVGAADGVRRLGNIWLHLFAGDGQRYAFAQNRNIVAIVNGGAPLAFNLVDGTVTSLGGNPPQASMVATVGDFTVLAGNPTDRQTWSWSGFANAEVWDGSNQSGGQTLAEGGAITGLAGGEFGLIFQRQAIYRITYTGGESVWQRDQISSEVGCIAPGSITRAGNVTFFLSERGFMKCDGSGAQPIGHGAIDATFFKAYGRSALVRMTAATDPRQYLAIWAMPGRPGALWCYNWLLDRWSVVRMPVDGVMSGFTPSQTAEQLATSLVDDPSLNYLPVDSARFAGGEPRLYAVVDNTLGTLTGPAMDAKLETADLEPIKGRVARINRVRVTGNAGGAKVTVRAAPRLGGVGDTRAAALMRTNGALPARSSGRIVRATVETVGKGWTYLQGLEIEAGAGGKR